MTAAAFVALAQCLDLGTYSAALRLGIGHEAWAAADNDPRQVIAGKAVIAALLVGVCLFRRRRAVRGYRLVVAWAIVWGVLGAASNLLNGGLI